MKSWDKIKEIILQFRGLTTIGITDVVGNAISAFFWFYIAAILGAEHYGRISYYLSIASIASTISLLGAQNTIIVYSAKNVRIQGVVYFISIIFGTITSIVLFLFFYNLGVSVYILGTVIFGLASSEILGKKLYISYAKYIIAQRILMVGLSVGLYYLLGPNGVILGIGLSYLLYISRIHMGFKESKIDFSILKPRFGFMMHNYALKIAESAFSSVDKLLIAPLIGFTLLGNYQLGLQFLSVLQLLPSIVFRYTLPHDASGNVNKKLKKLTILTSVVFTILGITLSPIIVPSMFPKFDAAVGVIQIVSLSLVPISINLAYVSKFLGNEKSKVVLANSIIAVVVQIIAIIILGRTFGVNGVAAAFVLAITGETIFYATMNRFIKYPNKI